MPLHETRSDVLRSVAEAKPLADGELRRVVLLADLEQLTITWTRYAPGERGPDLHVHREHVDAFYVLDGALTFALGPGGEQRLRVPAGGAVAVPPNVAHSFVNEERGDAHFLNLHAPDKGFAASMRARREGGDTEWDSFDAPADGGLAAALAVVSGPGEGERFVFENRVGAVKAVLPDLSLVEWIADGPFAGPPVHAHGDRVDAVYVLAGEVAVTVEDAVHVASPDTLAAVRPGVRHTFGAAGSGHARFLDVHAPDRGSVDSLRRTSD